MVVEVVLEVVLEVVVEVVLGVVVEDGNGVEVVDAIVVFVIITDFTSSRPFFCCSLLSLRPRRRFFCCLLSSIVVFPV